MGYSSSAYNYDINSIFLNPGLLSGFDFFISGYQYQADYSSYKGFMESLGDVLENNLINFESLEITDRENIHDKLNQIFDSKQGIYGFASNSGGSAFKRYGLAVSFINTAVINPERTSSFVNAISVRPLSRTAYRAATRSSQPHLLGLPVVVPNSFPSFRIRSPSAVNVRLRPALVRRQTRAVTASCVRKTTRGLHSWTRLRSRKMKRKR